jgi:hypothetical protein
MDAIYGMTMEMLAETMSKHGELRTKFGEAQGMAEFDRYLAGRGLDQHTWSLAHNAWHDRFRADPTGRAEAQFHMMLQQLSARAHFGDVRDMSQDTEEGITLDQYAQITVAVSRAGANADDVVRQFGLQDVAHWQRANGAWSRKMGEDSTHKLTMQYGQLYQKYAGPAFQEEMVAQTAGILAASHAPRDVVSEPERELTPDLCLQKMQSPSRNERWRYAGLYANMADLGNVPDKRAAIATVTPILLEMIEQHDEHTTSDAENGARRLWDLGDRSDDFRGAVSRCLNRAREKLTSVQAAFAPIQHQAVPERVTLQSRIQDYQSLVETMSEYQANDWSPVDAPPAYAAQPSGPYGAQPSGPYGAQPSAMFPQHSFGARAPGTSGGFPKWLLAPVILLVVGGIFFATKGRAMLAKHEASAATSGATSSTASPKASAPSANAGATGEPSPPSTAAAAPATTASTKAAAKKKKK